jgi:hypothetical protein
LNNLRSNYPTSLLVQFPLPFGFKVLHITCRVHGLSFGADLGGKFILQGIILNDRPLYGGRGQYRVGLRVKVQHRFGAKSVGRAGKAYFLPLVLEGK